MEIPQGDLPFLRTKPQLLHSQARPCWNRRLGFPRFFSQIVAPPFLGTKLWFKGVSPFWDPEKQFLSRSVLLKLIRFEWMSFSWKFGYRSWSQKLSPLCRCTKCFMLSVLSFNPPGIKLFSNKAPVGTFKEGTAFLGSDLGLRVLEMNFGPFKTEWKVLGPWSLDFCMASTLSINTETCAWRSMLTTSPGWTPLPESSFFTQGCCSWTHFAWFRPRGVGKQQFYWKKIYREVWFLKFWVSKFSSPRRIKKNKVQDVPC